ncbi:MAG: BON domain-containing protein [Moraxellaceae bacterium]|nr:BON domain-containing protein [Moraxellaceae bacterium]
MKNLFQQSKSVSVLLVMSLLAGCSTLKMPQMPGLPKINANGTFGVPVSEVSIPKRMIDRGIEKTAKVNIYKKFPELINKSRIKVNSFNGTVLLTGEVPNLESKQQIQYLLSQMPDIKNLFNELKISRPHSMSYNVQDGYITSQMMTKIIAHPRLRLSHVKIVTEMGIVYVMGRIGKQEQAEIVRLANATAPVLEVVFLDK